MKEIKIGLRKDLSSKIQETLLVRLLGRGNFRSALAVPKCEG